MFFASCPSPPSARLLRPQKHCATPKHAVTDEYQGVKSADDYRWLENWDDPAVGAAKQRAPANISITFPPARHQKGASATLIDASSASYYDLQYRAGKLFAVKYQPPQQQPMLVVMSSPDDPASAKVIFDPNAASAKGSLSMDFYVPSFGGKYVAAALSEGGSEDASAHVFDVETGKELGDIVPRVNFATGGGSIARKADNSGFYYTRYPQGNERAPEDANFYQQVYFHKLGTDPKQDAYCIGKEFPRIAEIQLHASDDGLWLLAAVANGDGGQFAHYLMDLDGRWTQLTPLKTEPISVKFSADPALYLLSRKDARRAARILRLPLDQLDLAKAKVVSRRPQARLGRRRSRLDRELRACLAAPQRVIDIVGGPSRARSFGEVTVQRLPGLRARHDLSAKGEFPLPPVSATSSRVLLVGAGDVLFYTSRTVDPPAVFLRRHHSKSRAYLAVRNFTVR